MSRPLLLLLFALVASVPTAAPAATITGTITWTRVSTAAVEVIVRDRHVCPGAVPVRQVEVDRKGRVARAIVWIEDQPAAAKLEKKEVLLDQRACVFVPVSLAATVGSTLVIASSDPVLHNVHIRDEAGATFANLSMPVMGQSARLVLTKPGVFTVRCEAGHTWMRAGLVVLPHAAFAISRADGSYTLREVAPGAHRVVAWHPELGRVEGAIVVSEAAPARLDLGF